MSATSYINAPSVIMRGKADAGAEPSNELLYGERVELIKDIQEGWAQIKARHDGYEGYIPANILGRHKDKTHKINVPATHLYETPDFKSAPRHALYFLSPVHATSAQKNGFTQLANGGWAHTQHLSKTTDIRSDFVETALMFINAPYIWGGRTAQGIDCSGLVQISLMAAGLPCPRDTKDQMNSLGENASKDISDLKRGDLVFFKRHVGIMVDQNQILNATSRHMGVVVEDIRDLEKIYNGIINVRRLARV